MMHKYGTCIPFEIPELKQKAKQTWLEHYGVDNPSKSELIKNKKI